MPFILRLSTVLRATSNDGSKPWASGAPSSSLGSGGHLCMLHPEPVTQDHFRCRNYYHPAGQSLRTVNTTPGIQIKLSALFPKFLPTSRRQNLCRYVRSIYTKWACSSQIAHDAAPLRKLGAEATRLGSRSLWAGVLGYPEVGFSSPTLQAVGTTIPLRAQGMGHGSFQLQWVPFGGYISF